MKIIRINKNQGDLVFDLFDKYRIFYKQESDIELAKKFIQTRLDNNESIIFVALGGDDSKPIAFTQLYPKYNSARAARNWILNDLYVEKEYRQQGVGQELIKTVLEFAKESNAKLVEISTALDNFTAQRLYQYIGFELLQPETSFYTYRINIV